MAVAYDPQSSAGGSISIGGTLPNTGIQGGTGINTGAINAQPSSSYQLQGPVTPAPIYTAPAPPQTFTANDGTTYTDAAAAAARNAAINSRGAALSGIQTGEANAYSQANSDFYNKVNPFINQLTDQQTSINQGRENALYSKTTSIKDLVDSIRQGINSGMIMLGSRNAGSSSAADALARAYSRVGSKGMGQISGQYAQDQRTLDTQQGSLNRSRDESVRQYHQFVADQANAIATDTEMQLQSLNSDAAYAGLSPLDVATLKNQIISAGQAKLAGLDSYLNGKVGSITAENNDQAQANAEKLIQAGASAPAKGYSFGMASPSWSGSPAAQTYNPISVLPLYLGNKDQSTQVVGA